MINFVRTIIVTIIIATPIFSQLPIQTFTISSGLKCFLIENHDKPLISIGVINQWNTSGLSGDKQDLGSFLAAIINAKNKKIINDIEYGKYINLGISHLTFSTKNGFYQWNLTANSRSQEAAMELLAEVIARPMFDAALVENQRNVTIKQLASCSQQKIAMDQFLRSINVSETLLPSDPTSLSTLTYQDVLDFKRLTMHPTTSAIAMYGDLDIEQAKQMISMYFGTWSPSLTKIIPKKNPLITDDIHKPNIWYLPKTNLNTELWIGITRPNSNQTADILLPIILTQLIEPLSSNLKIDFSLPINSNTLLVKVQTNKTTNHNLVIQSITILDKIRKLLISQENLKRALTIWKANNDTISLHPKELLQKVLYSSLNINSDRAVELLTTNDINQNIKSWLTPKHPSLLLFGVKMPSQEEIKNAGLSQWF